MNSAEPSNETRRHGPAVTVAVGLGAGLLSGLFGVGGGLLMVPGLMMALGFDRRRAHGTSLAAVLPLAIASLSGYWLDDKVDWPVATYLAIGAVAGAVVGTKLLHVLPHRTLAISFIAVLAVTAARLALDTGDAGGRAGLSAVGAIALLAVGLLSGVLAGLLGVGGGIIMVPAMSLGFGIPAAIAKGTSLAVIVPTSIVGTWRNRKHRNSDLRVAAIVGVSGMVAAFAGSQLAVRMSETLSDVLFAILLVIVAVRMIVELRSEPAH